MVLMYGMKLFSDIRCGNRRRVVCSLCLLFTCGCCFDPFSCDYTKKKPASLSIIGTWVLDAESKRLMTTDGKYPQASSPRLILSTDGSFEITDVPDWCFEGLGKSSGTLVSATGTWSIEKHQEWWAVAFSTKTVKSQNTSVGGFEGMLRGEAEPYKINLTVGDPDEGRAMVFVREPKN